MLLERPTYTTTIKNILNYKNVIEILKTSTYEDKQLLKTALTKAKICAIYMKE